jgi:rod shape-determining protein MreB
MDPWGHLAGHFGIDLGTANTVVCHPVRGVVLNEPSVMVVSSGTKRNQTMKPLLVGRPARELMGRTPLGMTAVRPLHDGVITDLESGRTFIVAILRKVALKPMERVRPRAIIGVPAGANAAERRVLIEAAGKATIGRASLIPEPIAGALGSGLNPLGNRAHLVVDVGGGTAEVTGFCFGGILASRSCRVAGDEMTLALHHYLRQEHQILVGELTVEDLKLRVRDEQGGAMVVDGLDAGSGRPKQITLRTEEAIEAIRPTSEGIVQIIAACLEELPPQAVSDVMQDGVLAFGGGSLLRGFDTLLEDAFGLPVHIAARPLTCVAEGAALCFDYPDVVRAYGG